MKHFISIFMMVCILFCAAVPALAMEPVVTTETNTPDTLSASTPYHTQIQVTTLDQKDTPLAGAAFEIYRASDNAFMQEIISDTNGIALSAQLPVDSDYYMLETTAPKGYQWLGRYFTLKTLDFSANTRTDLTVKYSPIVGQVRIVKSDNDGKLLSGAVFGLYNEQGQVLTELTTDGNGFATYSNLT